MERMWHNTITIHYIEKLFHVPVGIKTYGMYKKFELNTKLEHNNVNKLFVLIKWCYISNGVTPFHRHIYMNLSPLTSVSIQI